MKTRPIYLAIRSCNSTMIIIGFSWAESNNTVLYSCEFQKRAITAGSGSERFIVTNHRVLVKSSSLILLSRDRNVYSWDTTYDILQLKFIALLNAGIYYFVLQLLRLQMRRNVCTFKIYKKLWLWDEISIFW